MRKRQSRGYIKFLKTFFTSLIRQLWAIKPSNIAQCLTFTNLVQHNRNMSGWMDKKILSNNLSQIAFFPFLSRTQFSFFSFINFLGPRIPCGQLIKKSISNRLLCGDVTCSQIALYKTKFSDMKALVARVILCAFPQKMEKKYTQISIQFPQKFLTKVFWVIGRYLRVKKFLGFSGFSASGQLIWTSTF